MSPYRDTPPNENVQLLLDLQETLEGVSPETFGMILRECDIAPAVTAAPPRVRVMALILHMNGRGRLARLCEVLNKHGIPRRTAEVRP